MQKCAKKFVFSIPKKKCSEVKFFKTKTKKLPRTMWVELELLLTRATPTYVPHHQTPLLFWQKEGWGCPRRALIEENKKSKTKTIFRCDGNACMAYPYVSNISCSIYTCEGMLINGIVLACVSAPYKKRWILVVSLVLLLFFLFLLFFGWDLEI